MSDLQSAIYNLKRDISALESQASQLRSELQMLVSGCVNANSMLIATRNRINSSLENDFNALESSNQMLNLTMATQLQIKELFYIFKDVESANKKIRMLNNKLYFEFKGQSRVRKIVRGFLDNYDLDLVSEDRIEKSIEKSHLQSPDFWLTFVLLAIMAWKKNDKKRCEKCLLSALELDEKSTVIFMMLFNLRIKRMEVALKWFEYYGRLAKVGADENTYLMLLASISVKINERARLHKDDITNKIIDFIICEVEESRKNVDEAKMLETIVRFFKKMNNAETLQYENIRRYIVDAQNMANGLSLAKNNQEILEYLEDTAHVLKRERNGIVDKYIDELISQPCNGEIEIRREIELNEEIISSLKLVKSSEEVITSSSFKEIAKTNYEQKVVHDESKLNLCDELLKWGFVKRNSDASTLTSWNIFLLNLTYVKRAYRSYYEEYHQLNTKIHQIAIDDFSTQSAFENKTRDIETKNRFIENKRQALLKTAKKPMFYVFLVLAILAVAGGIFALVKSMKTLGIVALIVAAIFVIGSVCSLVSSILKKKKINARMDREKGRMEKIIEVLYEEKAEFDKEFAEADSISKDINNFLSNIDF